VRAFARGPVAAAWLLAAGVAGVACWRRRRQAARARAVRVPPRDPLSVFSVVAIVLVLAGCLATALLAPPSNGDALGYHLPRVRHWIQNRSLAHYPTASIRQTSFPPGGSYLVAHLQLLTDADRLASLPQWAALLGCVLVTASLGRRLGGRRARIATALAAASVPMAVLQAENPQTDLIAAFWLACFVHLVFATPRYRATEVIWLGLALGGGLVTKPTTLLFAAPFLALLAWRAGRGGRRAALGVPVAVLLVALLPSLPSALRNARTFGGPLGPDLGVALRRHDVRVLTSNVLRHAALDYPLGPVWRGVAWIHAHVLHLDTGDSRTTFPPRSGFDLRYLQPLVSADENFVASPIHLTIALVAAVVILRRRHLRGRMALRAQLALALGAGFVLYCGALCWQPWANRLLVPLVVLTAPLVGWALAAVSAPLRAAASGLLGVVGILLSLTGVRHPLLKATSSSPTTIWGRPRAGLYFAGAAPGIAAQYEALLHQATADSCARIELISDEYAPEDLVWITLDRIGYPVQIAEMQVDNPTRDARLELPGAEPCGRVTLQRDGSVQYRALRAGALPDGPL
jgi:4-amino-4-deoxy-L-arabinose transferase-like glycosyltransferase